MDLADDLSSLFRAFLGPAGADEANVRELNAKFSDAYGRARAAWPGALVDARALARHACATHPERDGRDVRSLDVHWEDLYLACACLSGQPAAHALFDARVLGDVARYVAHIDATPAFADEVRQRLRERLLMGQPPKIGEYTGRGPIGGWVRVAAIRTALNVKRERTRRERRDEGVSEDELFPPVRDPELEYLRARCAREVKEVFATVLQSLSGDQRNVLRMHYLDGLTLDEVGVAYGVHRATAARWIQQARDEILAITRKRIQDRLRMTPTELDSVLALVQTGLVASLRRMLDPHAERGQA
jgi:RNA polymerase sigma-70 factor (ECF subfamily)